MSNVIDLATGKPRVLEPLPIDPRKEVLGMVHSLMNNTETCKEAVDRIKNQLPDMLRKTFGFGGFGDLRCDEGEGFPIVSVTVFANGEWHPIQIDTCQEAFI